jgi:hypothetical protein
MKLNKIVMDVYNKNPSRGVCRQVGNRLVISSPDWSNEYSVQVVEGDITKDMVTIKGGKLPSFCHRIVIVDRNRNLIMMGDYPRFCALNWNGRVRLGAWEKHGHVMKYDIPTKVVWIRYYWTDITGILPSIPENDFWEYQYFNIDLDDGGQEIVDNWVKGQISRNQMYNCDNRKLIYYFIDRPPQRYIDENIESITKIINYHQRLLEFWRGV